jgi:hypothetical protein
MRSFLTALGVLSSATPLHAEQAVMPLYQSVADPPGQKSRKVLVDDSVLKFGRAGDDDESLLRSDLGFSLHFLKVDGGVRVRGQPILFPTGPREQIDLEDFSCASLSSGSSLDVLCRSKADGQLYRSSVVGGGLVSFEIRCLDETKSVCHYNLVSGPPIKPTHVQEQ